MSIVIRKAEEKDSPAINILFIEMLFSVYGTTDGSGYEEGYLERYFKNTGDMILLAEDGVIICEHRKEEDLPEEIHGFVKQKERRYGIVKLSIYR